MRLLLLLLCLILSGCATKVQTICPQYPKLVEFDNECFKYLRKFKGFICQHTDKRFYICYDKENAEAIAHNFEILFSCVEKLNNQIRFYNKVILENEK